MSIALRKALCACRHRESSVQISVRSFFSSIFSSVARRSVARPQLQTITLGNQRITDPFSWLSDYNNARDFLLEEQAHFRSTAQQLAPLQKQLLAELRQHIRVSQVDDPAEPDGRYLYRTYFTPQGTQTVTRCSADDPVQSEEVLVSEEHIQQDLAVVNQLTGEPVTGDDLTCVKLSKDQQLLAYGVATSPEQQCCIVKDLQSGAILPHLVLPGVTSFEWSADGTALYYTTPDDSGRPCKVYRRSVGGAAGEDVLLFHEGDVKHFVTLTRTKDWRYVLINTTSKLSSEVHLLDAHDPQAVPVCVTRRQPGLEYFVEHCAGHLLLLTNCSSAQQPGSNTCRHQQQGQHQHSSSPFYNEHHGMGSVPIGSTGASSMDYSLQAVPVTALKGCEHQGWQLLLPEVQGVATTDLDVFERCVVLHQLDHGRPRLLLLYLREDGDGLLRIAKQREVALPGWAMWLRPGNNSDYHSTTFRLYASSPAHPEVAMEVDLVTGTSQPLQHSTAHSEDSRQPAPAHQVHTEQQHLVSGFVNPADYGLVSQRLWAPAADGTAVPITLVHQQGAVYDGTRPLLVEVYGAYGQVLEAEFKPHRLPLLDRGWSVALAHVRGGGELGRRWHAAGRQLLKHNSVSDLLAVLEHLIQLRVTRPGLIAGHAASAGGLTLAAAINAQPQLFSAAVLEAPFIDWVAGTGAVDDEGTPVAGEHLLTQHETDEWGNPWEQPAVAELIRKMCPYTNLQPGVRHPAVLITTGLDDSRVPWWMAVKYVAKLRGFEDSSNPDGPQNNTYLDARVLLQFDEAGTHFSSGLSGGNLQDAALQQAFLCIHTPHASQRTGQCLEAAQALASR